MGIDTERVLAKTAFIREQFDVSVRWYTMPGLWKNVCKRCNKHRMNS